MTRQNSRSTSRRSDGAPGDFIAERPVNPFIHPAGLPTNTSTVEVLRPPVESAQYTSNDYLDFCLDQRRQLRPSVGRTAVCWDNAVAESFWGSLKRECIQGRVFATRAEARRAIFRWINWYNTTRLHTTLDGVPPLEWEQQYRQAS
jgi:transposase InsO family protein